MILGYEGVNSLNPCVLCLTNTPRVYWGCSGPCQKKLLYDANQAAEQTVKTVAAESVDRITHREAPGDFY
jgi:hypothetical protein